MLNFPRQFRKCNSCSELIELFSGLNEILLIMCSHSVWYTIKIKGGLVSCDYSLSPPSGYCAPCLAPSIQWYNWSLNKYISDPTGNTPRLHTVLLMFSHSALPHSVPVLQASWVPLSPTDWLHHPSCRPAPIPEPTLSFLQESGGTAGSCSGGFSSGLSESKSSNKDQMPKTYCILMLASWPIFMLRDNNYNNMTLNNKWNCQTKTCKMTCMNQA